MTTIRPSDSTLSTKLPAQQEAIATPTIQVTPATSTMTNGRQVQTSSIEQEQRINDIFQSETRTTRSRADSTPPLPLTGKLLPKGMLCPKTKDLAGAIDQINLKHISTETRRSSVSQPYRLQSLQISNNPVTKLEPAFHIPVEVARQACNQPLTLDSKTIFKAFNEGIQAAVKKINDDPNIPDAMKQQIKNSFIPAARSVFLLKLPQNMPQIPHETVMNKVQKELKEQGNNPHLTTLWTEIKANVSNLDNRARLDTVPIRYNKDEAISYLRAQHQKEAAQVKPMDLKKASSLLPLGGKFKMDSKEGLNETSIKEIMEQSRKSRDESPIKRRVSISAAEKGAINEPLLLRAIRQIQTEKSGYIDASVIESLDLDPALKTALKNSIKAYHSATDIMAQNDYRPSIMSSLKTAAKINAEQDPSYAFKLGAENYHESLGGKLASRAGLDDFLISKSSLNMDGAQLQDTKNPTGLASRWIPGESFPLPLWNQWLDVKHEYSKAKAEGTLTPELTARYEQTKQEVNAFGATKSIAMQIFFDAAFVSSDSHINQYKKGNDGELYNFDFARFFASSPVYTKEKGKAVDHFVNFRSDLLDHPLAEEPLTATSPFKNDLALVKDKVLSMNVNAIAHKWESDGLVGTKEFFAHHQHEMRSCELDHDIVTSPRTDKNRLDQLAKKYLGPSEAAKLIDQNPSIEQMRKAVIEGIQKKFNNSQQTSWSLAHPQAVQNWKEGVSRMQDYYRNTPEPTLKGAVHAYYGDLAPFMQTMETLERNPGSSLMINFSTVGKERIAKQASLVRGPAAEVERPSPFRTPTQAEALKSGMNKLDTAKTELGKLVKGANLDVRPMHTDQTPELILPQHYYGTDAIKLWTVWSENKQITDNFVTWVGKIEKGEHVPGLEELKAQKLVDGEGKIAIQKVTYMSPRQLEATKLTFTNGVCTLPGDVKPNTNLEGGERHIFVLGKQGSFYTAPYEKGSINHSSFFSGRPVRGAGEFIFKNGVLAQITSKSGHYKPDNSMILNTLQEINKKLGKNPATGVEYLKNVPFYHVTQKKEYPCALELMNQLQAEQDKPVKKLRSLESLVEDAKRSGRVPEAQIKEMERNLATMRSPTHFEARTGTPGI